MLHTTPRTKLAVAAAAVTLATGGLAVATAAPGAADGPNAHRAPDGQGVARPAAGVSASSAGAVSCNGGRSISMQSKIVTSAFSFTPDGGAVQDIPGTGLTLRGPRRGADTYLITYSAETRLFGAVSSDWMGVRADVDGSPVTPSDSDLAITGTDAWNSNSAQFCVRLGPGTHHLQMRTVLFSGASTSGWLDDYTTSVQRFS